MGMQEATPAPTSTTPMPSKSSTGDLAEMARELKKKAKKGRSRAHSPLIIKAYCTDGSSLRMGP